MQVACALISTWGSAGCGDGLYTPGVTSRVDASNGRDAATDAESGAFMTRFDASPDSTLIDTSPPATTVKVGGNSVVKVAQGGAMLTFEPQSFSPAAEVTIREISGDDLGVRGHYKPVFELTFAGGMPKYAPVLEVDLRGIVDESRQSVVGMGKSLVLARFRPASAGNPIQWLEIQQTTLTDDGLDVVKLERRAFEFAPHETNRMIVGVLLDCYVAPDSCQGTCKQMCSDRSLNCGTGGLCQ